MIVTMQDKIVSFVRNLPGGTTKRWLRQCVRNKDNRFEEIYRQLVKAGTLIERGTGHKSDPIHVALAEEGLEALYPGVVPMQPSAFDTIPPFVAVPGRKAYTDFCVECVTRDEDPATVLAGLLAAYVEKRITIDRGY